MNDPIDRTADLHQEPTGRPLTQRRAKATREGILEAAAIQFSRTGYAGTSISDIQRIANSTKGAMYFHFASKEAIAHQLLYRWSEAVAETIAKAEATGQPADRQILIVYRELARRVETEAITRAGLVLSLDSTITDAYITYEDWTEALTPLVIDAIRSGALDCAESLSRLAESLCAGFVGAVQVAACLDEPHTIRRRVDDLLLMWCGTDPVTVRKIEGATL
ncbi:MULTISPECIES: TetR/AcrR family transcriptional regulator [Rhodococcus erythropolis group]|uniref:TetR/AcrR family transcriptional regulator n=1 Tax=Rhodococcus erythropolis TaxID=1833 RepID=A0A8I0ZRI1_RHOER|nr:MULTISPECIES: TetR/AcrR family transcriptional regulator [Rhodococcus erythropolis group]MBH5144280.1 TetR/AcrR family transcriptional regulator [Rhodococcus erythropolis]MDJ0434737.1 TetR/AcrR family transcriptional regulator [Rhodococcus qingshengii]QEM25679.1 TetR/AcrR family transcriptional regulator [Rhodococcus qingshengii]